jgi:hypothetical protein
MSLMLEFRTPQNPETTSAGIGTNWFFPTITCLRVQLTAKVERLRGRKAAKDAQCTRHPSQSRPSRFRDLPIASLTLRNYQ